MKLTDKRKKKGREETKKYSTLNEKVEKKYLNNT